MENFASYVTIVALVGIPIAWGMLMASPPHDKFGKARLSFWISAIFYWATWILWGASVDLSFWKRSLFVAILATVGSILLSEALRFVEGREQAAVTPSPKAETEDFNNVLKFECSWSDPPSHYREDRTLYIVTIQGNNRKGIHPDQQVAGPSSFPRSSQPFIPSFKLSWYRCDVTNYGSKPLQDIQAKFFVQFLETIKEETGYRSGSVLAAGFALTPSIDLGPNGDKDYFYFVNQTNQFVDVANPSIAEFNVLGSAGRITASVAAAAPGHSGFVLPPTSFGDEPQPPPASLPAVEPATEGRPKRRRKGTRTAGRS